MRRRGLISLIILVFVIGLTACGRNTQSDADGSFGKAEEEKNSPGSDYTDYPQENIDGYNDSTFGGKLDVITDLLSKEFEI